MSRNCSNDLVDALADNIGRVVTIFTKSGGVSGCGFTGLLVSVNSDVVKCVTELPSAPTSPFGTNVVNTNFNRCRNELGTTVVIPVNAIASCVFNQV